MANILAICGSLRKGSFNRAVMETLPELAPPDMVISFAASIGDIPHYDFDVQQAGFPPAVTALADAIRAADGLVIVTPEYNYSTPGVLKNAIDWLSRLPKQPFAGKPVAIQSASGGIFGGARAQYHLRQSLVALDARVLNRPEIMVGSAKDKIDGAAMRLTDGPTRELIGKQLVTFAEMIAARG